MDTKPQPENAAQASSEKPRRIIKRYSNRKLYDTKDSRYVTLLQIAEMVRTAAPELGLTIAGTGRWDYRRRRFIRLAKAIERSGADGVFTRTGPVLAERLPAASKASTRYR